VDWDPNLWDAVQILT